MTSPAGALATVTVEDICAAQRRIEPYVHRTPLLSSAALRAATGAEVLSKAEHLQRTGSFKIRGALNRLSLLDASERGRGVVAFSSGNHAQGVALAAQLLQIPATIVMPSDAPTVKVAATLAYGATVVEYDRFREDREVVAARVAAERGAVIVPPFNDAAVIAGQGTVGLEAAEDSADEPFAVAVIPVGGGGLCAGMCIALKAMVPGIRIWGVEPAAADDARESLAAGRIVRIAQPNTIADGVATQAIGELTFPVLAAHLEGIVTVSEEEIVTAMRFVMERMKQVLEPTGALTTAALLQGRVPDVAGRRVLSVFCGGNLDTAALAALLASRPISRGLTV